MGFSGKPGGGVDSRMPMTLSGDILFNMSKAPSSNGGSIAQTGKAITFSGVQSIVVTGCDSMRAGGFFLLNTPSVIIQADTILFTNTTADAYAVYFQSNVAGANLTISATTSLIFQVL
jgi:hypothetical protein